MAPRDRFGQEYFVTYNSRGDRCASNGGRPARVKRCPGRFGLFVGTMSPVAPERNAGTFGPFKSSFGRMALGGYDEIGDG
jgi:hypothetical protein